MESILNYSAYPDISRNIYKCLGIKSISNLHMVNNELRKTVEYLFVSRAKSIFLTHFRKKSKNSKKISYNAGNKVEESVGEKV